MGKQSAIHMKDYTPRCMRRAATMIKGELQHRLNPVNLHCTLIRAGLSVGNSRGKCRAYEGLYRKVLG